MNIFYLDHDPVKCAMYHGDKHCVKMILESAQLLSSAHRVLDGNEITKKTANNRTMTTYSHPDPTRESELYKMTHRNHPCAIWSRETSENYKWLVSLTDALIDEYRFRYGKDHAVLAKMPLLRQLPNNIKVGDFTQPAQAMPDAYRVDGDSQSAYREYYRNDKKAMFAWKNRNRPEWL
jgi:hypothetical protein